MVFWRLGAKPAVVAAFSGFMSLDSVKWGLKDALAQVQSVTQWKVGAAYCDRGYQGNPKTLDDTTVQVCKGRKRSMTRSAWNWVKRRAAVEPIIGHLKADHRMERNHLKGQAGDQINEILAGCGYNIRKLQRELFWLLFRWLTGAVTPMSFGEA